MPTSIHSGLVPFPAAAYGAAADPVSAAVVRDGIANGLLHAADSHGQVRVNYMPIAAARANGQDAFATIPAPPTPGQWYQVGAGPFGPWPLTLRADGTPYRLRLRVGVAASMTGDVELEIRVVIAPADSRGTARALVDAPVDYVWGTTWKADDTGTTPTWATGATRAEGFPTMLVLDAATAAAWTVNTSTYDAVSSASPVQVQQVLVAAHVFAKTADAERLPRLHALHIAEYVGT